ncbi:hypothetical protein MAJ_08878, partial [Metarhizium majus ARSEF 297]
MPAQTDPADLPEASSPGWSAISWSPSPSPPSTALTTTTQTAPIVDGRTSQIHHSLQNPVRRSDLAVALFPSYLPGEQLPPNANDCSRESIQSDLTKLSSKFPAEADQARYTADHALIQELRQLMRTRFIPCSLCAYYEWGPIVETHKLKYCQHRAESGKALMWLDMFKKYQADGGGPGARCEYCRFPAMVCWRRVYQERMDAKYGNAAEALEEHDILYDEPRCDWVKVVQNYVTGAMVAGGSSLGKVGGVGTLVLEEMGWTGWSGLEENGPEHIRRWLQETDEIHGLRCPRLLKLFWIVANCT